ncbi:MAG: type II toxin-antitoxin system VapB family antitoxin [Xanthomonadales bacterium]|nr:type II toxin-antitoxin system VapB family antitoxin [Xanthomonadales bacterium]
MGANIVLNDDLVSEAQALSQIKTKRGLIEVALQEFVANPKRLDLRELRGINELSADYDYKLTRADFH